MGFLQSFTEVVAPKRTALFSDLSSLDTLPESVEEAVIVLIPKPSKNYVSYRPISLLNFDAKILAKVLVNRLSTVIEDLIHVDQTGFMPGKGTDINLKCLFLNLSISHDNQGTRDITH